MIRDLLLFLRAPLAATAIANLCLGLALARPAGPLAGSTLGAIALLIAATVCLYWAGMGLNDVFDLERDRTLFPKRPLPSGRLPLGIGRFVAWGLLASGVGLTGAASFLETGSTLRGLVGASVVALCILAYDGWLKRWRIPGALAMGACRSGNALAGAYALGWWSPVAGWTEALPIYALILGGYVTGLTFLSTYEDKNARPLAMTAGFLCTAAAPGTVIALSLINDEWRPYGLIGGFPLFGVVLAQWIMAILEGTRSRGEATTMALLKSLWLLDLGVLAGRLPANWDLLLGWGLLLWVLVKLGAKRLFRPPPGEAPEPEEREEVFYDPTATTSDLSLEPEESDESGEALADSEGPTDSEESPEALSEGEGTNSRASDTMGAAPEADLGTRAGG